jgi:ABC transport system ATP-binding/permease protein
LLVSHDRYFMDHLVDQLFIFEGDGKIRPFNGNYSDYRTMIEEKEEMERMPTPSKKIVIEEKSNGKKKFSFEEKNEFEKLPREIEKLESRKAELVAQLNSGSTDHAQLTGWSKQIEEITTEIEAKTMRWMELGELV